MNALSRHGGPLERRGIKHRRRLNVTRDWHGAMTDSSWHVSERDTIAGFVPVPDAADLAVETIATGLRVAVDVGLESIATREVGHVPGGRNH